MPRRTACALALTAVAALALPATGHAAPAAARYVALGDSYAAGQGSRTYYGDAGSCYRSPSSYGAVVSATYRLDLTLAACSGATTADVARAQVPVLSADVRYVTLTVGGNDLGFSDVLTECALPSWLGACDAAVDRSLQVLRTALPGRVTGLLRSVRARSPQAKVVVTGYPRVFNGTDCNAGTFFSATEMARLNRTADELNTALRTAAGSATFATVAPAFAGHAVCDPAEWINGLANPIVESYHPKVPGHRGYASVVGPALVGRPPAAQPQEADDLAVSLPPTTTAAGPAVFAAPDLGSAEAERAARRAGITPTELNRLRTAQRAGASNATLERLDAEITDRAAARAR